MAATNSTVEILRNLGPFIINLESDLATREGLLTIFNEHVTELEAVAAIDAGKDAGKADAKRYQEAMAKGLPALATGLSEWRPICFECGSH